MRKFLFLLLITISFTSQSAVVIWPDSSAPCNGTLQACINASLLGDLVEIHTNIAINETLFIDSAISVIAGNGYSPSFTAGNYLQLVDASIGASSTVSIKCLTFNRVGKYCFMPSYS
ncbi:MAG: hypothetical protein JKX98_12415 [Alcanivoracaceae bacterium]|nr:hypothetical protein [Alcanivoracaceae bacterium]